jgi:hypothetical protein
LDVGHPLPDKDLAKKIGVSMSEVLRAWPRLQASGLFEQGQDGVWFCPSLVRDNQLSELKRVVGAKGGNPALKQFSSPALGHLLNQSSNQHASALVNQPVKQADSGLLNNLVTNLVKVEQEQEQEQEKERERSLVNQDDPEAHVPTVDEVIAHGGGPVGIPSEFCRHYHLKKEIARTWFNYRGNLVNWRAQLLSWWTKDRHTWRPKPQSENTEAKDRIDAELQWQKNPARMEELQRMRSGL